MKNAEKSEPAINGTVRNILPQNDGKFLVAGEFSKIRGQERYSLGRLNPDGSLDTSFEIKDKGRRLIKSIALQKDGKILIGGILEFKDLFYLIRLLPDGSLDYSFIPFNSIVYVGNPVPGFGRDGMVTAISIQKNGTIIIGKNWGNSVDWITPQGEVLEKKDIKEVEYEGLLTRIVTGSLIDVRSFENQDDGKLIVGSLFNEIPNVHLNQPKNNIFRLNSDGSLDNTLDLGIEMDNINNEGVFKMEVLDNGSMLVTGSFKKINEKRQKGKFGMFFKNQFIKFNADGTRDESFNPEVNGDIIKFFVQPDGKIIILGWFSKINEKQKIHIARLHSNGNFDSTFTSVQVDGGIVDLNVLPNGKLLIGGKFKNIDGEERGNLARLNPDGALDHSFL